MKTDHSNQYKIRVNLHGVGVVFLAHCLDLWCLVHDVDEAEETGALHGHLSLNLARLVVDQIKLHEIKVVPKDASIDLICVGQKNISTCLVN
jgi:hypothetical protein